MVRAYLRHRWPQHRRGERWDLTDAQVVDVCHRFGLPPEPIHIEPEQPLGPLTLDHRDAVDQQREPVRLLASVGVGATGTRRWGEAVSLDRPGVYVISLVPSVGPPLRDEIALDRVRELLDRRPELRIHGRRPTPVELRDHLASMLIPDTTIVYIGLAGTSVRQRVRQYGATRIGARGPHAGGWPLKMLTRLADCHVTYAACDDPKTVERRLLDGFSRRRAPDRFVDPECVIPFANLDHPGNRRQRHGVTGARAPR